MEKIGNILYVTVPELIEATVNITTIKVGLFRHRKGIVKCWDHIKIGRQIFIKYDSLNPEYKILLQKKQAVTLSESKNNSSDESNIQDISFLTPNHPLLSNVLVCTPSDVEFINNYCLPNKKYLPAEKAKLIIEGCTILHAIERMKKKQIKKIGFKNTTAFYKALAQYIETNNIPLPTTEMRLRQKACLYKKQGAIAAIPKYFGRTNNNKIGKDQEASILMLASLHHQLNAVQIANIYNNTAIINKWPPVCPRTIINVCKKHRVEIKGAREGVAEWRNEFDHSIKRVRPSAPNLLWVGDGWDFELYYQKRTINSKQNSQVSYWERKKVYMVIDAFNDYIVGYAIGDNETIELSKAAWKNACVKQSVLPYQIKTDNFAKSELAPFYQQLCSKVEFFTPSSVGNARDKVIERMFGQLYGQVVRYYPNASGRNIRAKEQPNRDYLDKTKHSFPDEQGVILQIEDVIHRWNTMQREKLNKKSFEQQYKEADHSKDRMLTDLQRLQYFGIPHKHLNTFTKSGLEVTINGEKITYRDWDNKDLMDSIGTQYQIVYDLGDLSKVLALAEGGRIRHIVAKEEAIPMALMDMKEGDRTRLNKRLNEKKRNIQENVLDKANARELRLDILGIKDTLLNENSAEGALKLRPTVKGLQKPLLEIAEKQMKIIAKEKEPTQKFVPYEDKLTDDCKPIE